MYTEGFPQLIFEEITSAKEGESLPDLFAKLFVRTINEVIETGLYRKYYRVAEQTNTIRGRILISQTIRSPNIASGKVWCEYDKIGFDVLENQAILCCTNLLLYLVRKSEIKDDLLLIRNTLLSLDVSQATIESYQIETVNLHRLNEHYEYALILCKYILDQIWYREFSVDEELDVISWFHDMNDLFEKFVTRVLLDELIGFRIRPQKPSENILEHIEGEKPPKMRPDNLIQKNNVNRLVVDTKYKKDGASSADFYQATSYSLKLRCDTLLLLPQIEEPIKTVYQISGEELKVYANSIEFREREDMDIIEDLKNQILDVIKPRLS